MTHWAYTHSFTYTVGTTLAIYCTQTVQPHLLPYLRSGPIPPHLHMGHQPRQLLYTDCPDSVPPLLVQWAHTSSFYDTVGLYPLIYLHSEYQPRHLLYTDCPASFPPSLAQWAHTSSFYDTVGLYPLIYLHSEYQPRHLLYTDCPASFPPSLAQWAHTSSFYDTEGLYPLIDLRQWEPHSQSTVHRLSSLSSCFTCTVGPYLLIL